MAANRDPIWSRAPDNQVAGAILGPTAQTGQDGSASTGIYMVFKADPTNGGYVSSMSLRSVGAPAATVMRVYLCTDTGTGFTAGTTNTTANTSLIGEMTLPLVTLSQVASSSPLELIINRALEANQKILVTFGTSTGSAGTGYAITTWAGKY